MLSLFVCNYALKSLCEIVVENIGMKIQWEQLTILWVIFWNYFSLSTIKIRTTPENPQSRISLLLPVLCLRNLCHRHHMFYSTDIAETSAIFVIRYAPSTWSKLPDCFVCNFVALDYSASSSTLLLCKLNSLLVILFLLESYLQILSFKLLHD